MLLTNRMLIAGLVAVLAVAVAAEATLVDLYPIDDLEATRRAGDWRAQKFNPTTSLPNSIGGPGEEMFDTVGTVIRLDADEYFHGEIDLYIWDTDISETTNDLDDMITRKQVNITNDTGQTQDFWIMLDLYAEPDPALAMLADGDVLPGRTDRAASGGEKSADHAGAGGGGSQRPGHGDLEPRLACAC